MSSRKSLKADERIAAESFAAPERLHATLFTRAAVAALLSDHVDEDAAAILALPPGKDWSRLVFDADRLCASVGRDTVGRSGSLRIVVGRATSDEEGLTRYCVQLQQEVDTACWATYRQPGKWAKGDERRAMRAHVETLAEMRPFFAHVPDVVAMEAEAMRCREAWYGGFSALQNGHYEPEDPAQPHAPEAAPDPAEAERAAIESVLALPVGGRYVEEGWGPWYLAGSEPDEAGYAFTELRLAVERRDVSHRPFRIVVQQRSAVGGAWGDDDLGLSPVDRFAPIERYADERALAANLAMFRATLRVERVEAGEDPVALSERERHGITDEHLRSGTLSERTRAELAGRAAA